MYMVKEPTQKLTVYENGTVTSQQHSKPKRLNGMPIYIKWYTYMSAFKVRNDFLKGPKVVTNN